MRPKLISSSVVTAIVLAGAVSATTAQGQLNTQHIKGVIGLKGGSPPPPGTYLRDRR